MTSGTDVENAETSTTKKVNDNNTMENPSNFKKKSQNKQDGLLCLLKTSLRTLLSDYIWKM